MAPSASGQKDGGEVASCLLGSRFISSFLLRYPLPPGTLISLLKFIHYQPFTLSAFRLGSISI